jgi:hypothetical protein
MLRRLERSGCLRKSSRMPKTWEREEIRQWILDAARDEPPLMGSNKRRHSMPNRLPCHEGGSGSGWTRAYNASMEDHRMTARADQIRKFRQYAQIVFQQARTHKCPIRVRLTVLACRHVVRNNIAGVGIGFANLKAGEKIPPSNLLTNVTTTSTTCSQ